MVGNHNVLIAASGIFGEVSTVICVYLVERFIPEVDFVGPFGGEMADNSIRWGGISRMVVVSSLGGSKILLGLHHVALDGLTRLRVILGRIGIGELRPSRKFSGLDGLDPRGFYGES